MRSSPLARIQHHLAPSRPSRRPALAIALGLVLSWLGTASAQSAQAPELVGMTQVKTITPMAGFIDDPFAFDDAGQRLLYVNADTGYMAELVVLGLGQGMVELGRVDISGFTTAPVRVRFVDQGYFVVAPEGSGTAKGKKQRSKAAGGLVAAVIDGQGKVVRRFGPATDISLIERDGQAAVTLYQRAEKQVRKRGATQTEVRHTVEALALATGKRLAKKKATLVTDGDGRVAAKEFRVDHFERGYTVAVGIKDGAAASKDAQRSPDYEAWYDLLAGTFIKRVEPKDLMAHARLMRARAAHPNQDVFLAVSDDRARLELVDDAAQRPVQLAEDFAHYDPRSLVQHRAGDGRFLFTLTIDPMHKEAAARKRAAPEYMDLYEYRPGAGTQAKRLARMLMDDKKRSMSWRATDQYWILVPRLIGFSRGGKELRIYRIDRR